MASCEAEKWTLDKLSRALIDETTDGKKIVVPMFQRGERWKADQEKTFIDSLLKGYPIGTMLFYKRIENAREVYLLIDGLQRGNTIRKYMEDPTQFFNVRNIPDESCAKILAKIESDKRECYSILKDELTKFIREQRTFKNVQYTDVAVDIIYKCKPDMMGRVGKLVKAIAAFFEDKQEEYDRISNTSIPVIVYSGEEKTLPEIFTRINSKGTPLDQYEIYAASWPVDEKFPIKNDAILGFVAKKYETLIADGYSIQGFDKNDLIKTRHVNAYEYLFGLGKYLSDIYPDLRFKKKQETDDMVNPVAFELVNACLNDTDRISTLYERINAVDINKFENALIEAIKFVLDTISAITKFKGNKHKEEKNNIFHSKFQILSMISTTFKEMYPMGDYSEFDEEWDAKRGILIKNMRQYYVYDIITNEWSEGGTAKIYKAAKPNRYMRPLSGRTWAVALNGFFEHSMQRSETTKIGNPGSEELVFLNCIYLQTFSAMDQLSEKKFDVEHIATKEQMKALIKDCKGQGLPISCIANLCYLPEYDNRSKGKNNFYQDKKYKSKVNIEEIEKKYSFTNESDLDWMNLGYANPEDFDVLREEYENFLTKRFDILKRKFCAAMEIEYIQDVDVVEENGEPDSVGQEWIDVLEEYDFSGKTIIGVQIGDKKIKTRNATNAYCVVHKFLYAMDKQAYTSLGAAWFSNREDDKMRDPYKIDDTAFISKNKSSNEKMKTIRDILHIMLEPPKIALQVSDTDEKSISDSVSLPFDIYDESTYSDIPIGKMAYYLFKDAVEGGFVSDDEIKLLMDKEYTHNLFRFTHYPVLADDVNANRGNSETRRYRKTAILHGGKKLYVTTQWFDGNRKDVINWYKNHKND